MEIINNFIFIYIGLVVAIVVFPFIFKLYGFKYLDGLMISVLQAIIAPIFCILLSNIENGEFGFTGIRQYGSVLTVWLVPLIYTKIRKINTLDAFDVAAMGNMVVFGFSKINCAVQGCCEGIIINGTQVPIQIIEAITAFVIAIVLFLLRNKLKGYIYPTMLIGYGIIRFIQEYFRFYYKYELLFRIFSWGQIWSIVSLLLGIIFLFVIRYIKQKQTN